MSEALVFEILTLFPEAVDGFLRAGLMGKAMERGLLEVHCVNPRDFTSDRHRTVDDTPYGGGPGMVMKVEPVVAALEHVEALRGPTHRVLLTPSAPRFDQHAARRLAALPRVTLLCGRYEGIDDRVRESFAHESLSLGDFVLNGGEVAALAIVEAVARLREGVLGNAASAEAESFATRGDGALLEHPQYTRPPVFRGLRVPALLVRGDHGRVEQWRRASACARTWALRPELRPRRSLAPDTHRWLVTGAGLAGPEASHGAVDWAALAREHGFMHLAARARSTEDRRAVHDDEAGLRHLRRLIRKRAGAEPWLVALALSGEHTEAGHEPAAGGDPAQRPATSAAELLDRLAVLDALPGLVLDRPIALLVGFSTRAGVDAVYAPPLEPEEKKPVDSLAIRPQLIDSSRPPLGGVAATVVAALRAPGLGKDPVSP